MVKNKVSIKHIYNQMDLDRHYFYEPPSTCAQPVIGESYPIGNEIPFNYLCKLSDGSASKLYKCLSNNEFGVVKKIKKNEEWRNELYILEKLSRLNSDRFLKLLGYIENYWYAYIVCQYYEGRDLFDHVIINAPYPMEYVKYYIKEMLLCIKECHDNGIVHLDIKCENFMLDLRSRLVLIDFGHAELLEPNVIKKLENGSYGTLYYLCPEGYKGYYSTRSDIWSIGVCAFLLITGEFPFDGDDDEYEENVTAPYSEEKYDFIRSIKDPDAREFIRLCLQENPMNRPDVNYLLRSPFIQRRTKIS